MGMEGVLPLSKNKYNSRYELDKSLFRFIRKIYIVLVFFLKPKVIK